MCFLVPVDTFIIGLMVFHVTSLKQFQGVGNITGISSLRSRTKGVSKNVHALGTLKAYF